jgi:VanZ family protein
MINTIFLVVEKRLKASSQLLLWGFVVLWYGVIFYLSHIPAATSASTKGLVGGDDTMNAIFRFCAHLGVFGVLGILLYAALQRSFLWLRRSFIIVLFCTLLFAISDEAHQYYVPGRHARLQDICTDIIGAGISVYAVVMLRRFSSATTD